ncbi:hypothetical protein LCGC14_0205310 [marine sediment metagenome]|uniref:pantoate--beta-alanine ligase (AMP-forming) n=1 Tax=marine sediment metagenome TaxID=412755 RepID=A0A0F9XL16_9ZZZZ|nr:pantoate--beta-alanine ligase [Phycisphaerae bacterium]HDZ44737.1 pantoate--beta-alanine ligase [Phycisphaerae bacterium]
MKIITDIAEMRRFVAQAKAAGKTVGLVATLGGMHEGHLSLIDAARADCDVVVVSIFLNPTQFGPSEDLAAYPRTPEADHAACDSRGVDVVFAPSVKTIYGGDSLTEIRVRKLSETLCGRSRPIHFTGVCTVVAKLFNIIPAHKAYFGAKDYQQSVVIRRMVADLNAPIEIVVCPTVREGDGLALSTRNKYLSADERGQAAELYGALSMAAEMIRSSRPPAADVIAAIGRHLAERAPLGEIDYVQTVDPDDLTDVQDTDGPLVIALAVRFGGTRLIDNMRVDAPAQAN